MRIVLNSWCTRRSDRGAHSAQFLLHINSSLTKSVLAAWARRGTPRQVEFVFVKTVVSRVARKTFRPGTASFHVRQGMPLNAFPWRLFAMGEAPILLVGPSNTIRWP